MDSLAADRTGAPLEHDAARSASGVTLTGVYACFFLSGFAALLYQTAWLRQFSIVFGTSDLAVGAVLAAYMAGLALGAAVGGRIAPHVRRPVVAYALLELGIAGAALLVPVALRLADRLLVSTIGGRPDLVDAGGFGSTAFYLVTSFVVLLVPTALMGATLPLLARYAVRRREEIGSRVGSLYATNTAGAVAGTLVAAFVLLPSFGLSGTVWWGVGVNGAVFLLAAAVGWGARAPLETAAAARPATDLVPGAGWVLPWMLVAGAVSFTYEVLWTRLLSHLLGASVYAFATMLASFLAGIAIGSAIAARLATTRARAARGLVVAQLATALLSIGVYWLIDRLPGLSLAAKAGEQAGLASNASVAMLVLLPATLCIGATFPFALRLLARDEQEAALASGRVYAWNTFGAIAGAVLASFVVVPSLGFGGTTKLAVSTNAALALVAALLWLRGVKGLALGSAATLAVAVVVYWPSAPEHLLVSSPFVNHRGGRLIYEGVGRTSSVAVVDTEGEYYFRCNGLPEGGVTPRGAPVFGHIAERWLTILPALARPEARSMMVIGLGAGAALESVPPQFEKIDVIELEPRVVEANHAIADLRDRDPLADPRLHVVHDDARGALALTTHRWDAIVNQPSHPWTAGASHLYTIEFLRDVRRHLTDRGVFVQWMQTSLLTEDLLRSITATVGEAFEHVRLYRPIPDMLIFLASPAPLDVEFEVARSGAPLDGAPDFYARSGIFGVADVVAMLALDEAGVRRLAGDAPLVTDDRNILAMESTHALAGPGRRQPSIDQVYLAQLLFPYDPLINRDETWGALFATIDPVYLVYRLVDQSLAHRALTLTQTIQDPAQQLTAMGFLHWRGGFPDVAQQHWVQAMQTDPDYATARFATIMRALSLPTPDGENAPEVLEIAEGLPEPAMAVVHGWRHFRKNDWAALKELEEPLAQATPTDLWFQEASRLRATWRVMLPTETPDEHVRHAREAVALLDRATILHPDPLSYLVRMTAAIPAQYPAVLLETINHLTYFLAEWKERTPEHIRALIRAGVAQLQPALVELSKDERIPAERLEETARRVELVLSQP